MTIPEEYIVQKFYQHAGYPKYSKSTTTYSGGCPICREGSSWGRKRRLYYIPKELRICCHNCGWYGSPIDWIQEVERITYKDILKEIETLDYEYGIKPVGDLETNNITVPNLPVDSINLFDKVQLKYHANENIVRQACELIIKRRLNTAINRPKSLYVSLVDKTHRNRLVIPFYNRSGSCDFYQSRTIIETDENYPKYLSKIGSEKTLFNFDNIQSSADNIFITEGPIDSFFIRNSVAVAGIQENSKASLTKVQQQQMEHLFLTQSVWVLDSQWQDTTSLKKSRTLLDAGECVFIWPENIGRECKDINDICTKFKIDEVSEKYLLDNTYCGLKGIVKLSAIK